LEGRERGEGKGRIKEKREGLEVTDHYLICEGRGKRKADIAGTRGEGRRGERTQKKKKESGHQEAKKGGEITF